MMSSDCLSKDVNKASHAKPKVMATKPRPRPPAKVKAKDAMKSIMHKLVLVLLHQRGSKA